MENPKWPFITFRVFAATNFLVAILGGLFLVITVISTTLAGAWGNTRAEPYFTLVFCAMIATNICFLGLLVFGGFHLLRRRMLGVTVCNVVFVAEILYFVIIGSLWGSLPRPISMSVAAATGVGNMGLGPQLVSGYPLIALVCLNAACWRLNRQRPEGPSVLMPSAKS